jgi:hypothetical protein
MPSHVQAAAWLAGIARADFDGEAYGLEYLTFVRGESPVLKKIIVGPLPSRSKLESGVGSPHMFGS